MKFVFQNKYPQDFLDRLAEKLGIKWTKVEATTVGAEKISVCSLPPPSGFLYYVDMKCTDAENDRSND